MGEVSRRKQRQGQKTARKLGVSSKSTVQTASARSLVRFPSALVYLSPLCCPRGVFFLAWCLHQHHSKLLGNVETAHNKQNSRTLRVLRGALSGSDAAKIMKKDKTISNTHHSKKTNDFSRYPR